MKRNWLKASSIAKTIIFSILFINTIVASGYSNSESNSIRNINDDSEVISDTVKNEFPLKYVEATSGENGSDLDKGKEETKNNLQQKNQDNERSTTKVTDTNQVYLMLAAIFGVGSFFAVLLSVLYKIYLSKRVVTLPVLYYEKREEVLNE